MEMIDNLQELKTELLAKLAACSSLDMFCRLCYTYWEKGRELEMEINSNDDDADIINYLNNL
jgi:hypothetical protein